MAIPTRPFLNSDPDLEGLFGATHVFRILLDLMTTMKREMPSVDVIVTTLSKSAWSGASRASSFYHSLLSTLSHSKITHLNINRIQPPRSQVLVFVSHLSRGLVSYSMQECHRPSIHTASHTLSRILTHSPIRGRYALTITPTLTFILRTQSKTSFEPGNTPSFQALQVINSSHNHEAQHLAADLINQNRG